MSQDSKFTNRLVDETSPYLLQHAHNPVDWYPWGEEALQRAKDEDKPILLSIGYSACHWCHVMERESFENEDIADYMNTYFVNVKVDREERPDLDEIYMAATVTMNHGRGGWPMTVFLTPEMKPFFAGTYFPPTDRQGMPGFQTVLVRMAEIWKNERDMVLEESDRLTDHLESISHPQRASTVGEQELKRAVGQLARAYDSENGGFTQAPKFPPATHLRLLMRFHRRTQDPAALDMVVGTLDAMADGGMYDHIGGGFARYSTDEIWLVPHFEKMLYDNALLTRAYLEAYQITKEPEYARVASDICSFVLRELTHDDGGFFSALDADSEGVEGKFYVWTPAQIADILGEEDGKLFCSYYDITAAGNWEGHSIPNTRQPVEDDVNEDEIYALRDRVYEARTKRVWPGLDDKVLTAWNGLMIGALAEAARVLDEPRYRKAAANAADFLHDNLTRDGRLLRTWRDGKGHLAAYLEDYAYLTNGLIDLYESGADAKYLHRALALATEMVELYSHDENDAFCTTARDHESLILRKQEGNDGATPSANGVAVEALMRLAAHFSRDDLHVRAQKAIEAYGAEMETGPRGFSQTLLAVDFALEGPVEIAVVGPDPKPLLAELRNLYIPNRVLAVGDGQSDQDVPLLAGKTAVDGAAALYICRDFTCQAPITDASHVVAALEQEAAARSSDRRRLLAPRRAGHATAEGTQRYAKRFAEHTHGYTKLGRTNLTTARTAFGTYRVDDRYPPHADALRAALLSGCNLIDTSTNYTDGHSESLVGQVLNTLIDAGQIARDEIIVVSKAGYMQGQNLALAQEREQAGEPFPDVVKFMEGCWHCVHPDFIDDQLSRSLDRLRLETLDVLLLHNPEYFFEEQPRARDEFYRRLTESFKWMEAQVAAGRLRAYGVSSNSAAFQDDHPKATSLARMLEAAQEAGGDDHHFCVLQLPMNLYESDAITRVLPVAVKENVGVLLNRPLNAITPDRLVRLADYDPRDETQSVSEHFGVVGALETEFDETIAPQLGNEQLRFGWSRALSDVPDELESADQWHQIVEQQVAPRLNGVLRQVDHSVRGDVAETWSEWRDRYLPALEGLLAEVDRIAQTRSQARSDEVSETLDPLLPETHRDETLARKALWVLTSSPGVSSVLNGMRQGSYVEDAVAVLSFAPMPDPQAVLEGVRESPAW